MEDNSINIELEQRNKELEQKIEFLTILLDSTYDWELYSDKDGKTQYCSPAIERILGYNQEEYLNGVITIKHIIHPDDYENAMANYKAVQNGKYLDPKECRFINKNNETVYLEIAGQPVFNKENEYIGVRTSIRDATDRKNSEAKSKSDRVRFELAIQATNDGIWEVDLISNEVFLSAKWKEQLGYKDDESQNEYLSWENLLHPEDKKEAINNFNNFVNSENDKFDVEFRIKHKNGSFRLMRYMGIAVKDDFGKIQKIIGAQIDITEIKESQQELDNAKALYKLIADYTYDWEVYRNIKGEIIYSSPAMENITGFSNIDYLAGNLQMEDIIHPDDYEDAFSCFQKAMNGKEISSHEFRLINKDGLIRNIEVAVRPVLNNKNDLVGIRSSLRDITNRKQQELEIVKNNNRLESLQRILVHQSNNIEDLLDYSLNEALQLTNSKIGYIYSYNKDEKQFILNTWSKDVMAECAVINPQTVYASDMTGILGDMVRTRKPVILNDFHAPILNKKGYPEGHVALKRYLSIPVFFREDIVAVIGLGKNELDYNDNDVRQITLLMSSVWNIISRRRQEKELKIANSKYAEQVLELKKITELLDTSNKALSMSEEKFKIVADYSYDWETFRDNKDNIIYVSPAFEKITGYQCDEYLNGQIQLLDLIHPDDREAIKEARTLTVKGESIRSINYRIIRKDGGIRFCESSALPVNINNVFLGHRVTSRDITKQKEYELEIQKLSAVVTQSSSAIVITDITGTIEYVNEAFTNISGYFSDELIGQNPRILKSGFQTSEFYRDMWNTVLSGGIFQGEFHNKRKDGELFWEEAIVFPIFNNENKTIKLAAIKQDITERKKIDQKLKESEEKFRTIVQLLGEGLCLLNTEEQFIFANSFAAKIFEIPDTELSGKFFKDFVTEDTYNLIKYQSELRREGNVNSYEIDIITAKNNIRTIIISASPMYKEEVFIGSYGVFRDITELKESEKLIQKQNEELKEIIALKDKFFSIVAHDLRSPFSGFLGLSDLMAKDADDLSINEIKNISIALNTSANSLYKLLEDLLLWSKSQSGSLPFIVEELYLSELVFNSIFTLQQSAANKEIVIEQIISKDIIVFGDRNMIMTVIRNLLSNAIKFTKENGKITIGVIFNNVDSFLQVFIKDTGVGISEENIEKMFKIDQNITTPGTNKEKGSGLGLLLCKDFIENHCGKIWVESELGQGSTFSFTLPVNQSACNSKYFI